MRSSRLVLLLVAGVLLVSAARIAPRTLFIETPGEVLGLSERVTVSAPGTKPIDGDFLLTTVLIQPGTVVGLIDAWVDAEARVIPAAQLFPPDQDPEEYFDRQEEVFDESASQAAAVGLRAAGFEVSGDGALVVSVLPGTAAEGALAPGDVIVAADGQPIGVADELQETIRAAGPDDPVRLTVRREGRTVKVEVAPRSVAGGSLRPILGIEVSTVSELPVPVDVDVGPIGGPSAGLMIALTVFDKVDPVDLAAGRQIAGTGTLTFDGRVGPIGGIEQKVLAAGSADVEVFLVPAEQLEDARAGLPAGSDMELIGVQTFQDAVDALMPRVARG